MGKVKLKLKNEEFRRELSGAIYQVKILLLLLWQGLMNGWKFRLRTEVEDAEKFDDALFYHRKEDGKFCIKFLQIKHARYENATLKYEDFVSDFESAKCNLRKYFISFRKIQQQFTEEELEDFILCTNIPLSCMTLKAEKSDSDAKALQFQEHQTGSPIFSLKYGERKQYKLIRINEEINEVFKESTNIKLLAEELINCIINNEKDGKEEVELDLRNYWFSLYHCALMNDKIIEEQTNVKLREKFIYDFKNTSDFQRRFMDYLNIKTTLSGKELQNYKLNRKFYINDIKSINTTKTADRDELNQSAKILINHVLSEGKDNLENMFNDNSTIFEVLSEMKNELYDSIANLDEKAQKFSLNLQIKLQANFKDIGWEKNDTFEKMLNNQGISNEEIQNHSNNLQNLAKKLVQHSMQCLSDIVIVLDNDKLHKIVSKTDNCEYIKGELMSSDNTYYEFSKFKKCLIKWCAVEMLRKREQYMLPKLMVDHLLDGNKNEIIEAYLSNAALFNQFKNVIRNLKENAFSDSFIKGENLNKNGTNFRQAVLKSYQTKLAENLVNHEFAANPDFIGLLKQKNGDALDISNDNVKKLAKEIVIFAANKMRFVKNHFFEKNIFLLKQVFEECGVGYVKFLGSFLNILQKKKKTETQLHGYFSEYYAIEKLKIKSFILPKHFGERNPNLPFKEATKSIAKFADEIVEIIKGENSMNDDNKILVYDKTKYSKGDTKDVLEYLQKNVFETTSDPGTLRFRDYFFDQDESMFWPEAILKTKLKNYLSEHQFHNLRSCEIKIINVPPCYDSLEEVGDIDEDIANFLQKLILVYTPNETKLTEVIEKEVSKKFNLIDTDIAADYLLKKVLNWVKEKEERFLDEKEAKTFLKEIEQKIVVSMVTGTNSSYCAKLREYGIEFKEFINIDFKEQILHVTSDQPLLTAIKMEQTLRQYFENKISYNIISTSSLLPIKDEMLSSMQFKINLLVIIHKIKLNKINTFLHFWEKLCDIVKKNPSKKVILVTENQAEPNFKYIERSFSDLNIDFVDLSMESQSNLENIPMIFQNKPIDGSHFFNNLRHHINSQVLMEFISNGEIRIGKSLENFTEDTLKYYVKRKIKLMKMYNKIIENNSNNIFLFEAVESTNFDDVKKFAEATYKNLGYKNADSFLRNNILNEEEASNENSKYGYIIKKPHSHEDVQRFCKMHLEKCIYWLKLNKNEIYLYNSYIPPLMSQDAFKFIQLNINNNNEGLDISVDEDHMQDRLQYDKILLISDRAGIGKSTVLTSFTQKLNNVNLYDPEWKIRINLNLFTLLLSEIGQKKNFDGIKLQLKFGEGHSYEEIILRLLDGTNQSECKAKSFEDYVFDYCFRNGKVLIIFDGFDEISPDYEVYVMNLFIKLKTETQNRLWITSRTNFKEPLEKNLHTFAYRIKPFDEDDQKNFLMKFWQMEWEQKYCCPLPNQSRLEKYVTIILLQFYEAIGNKHADKIGIPLLIKMLAQAFQENEDNYNENWEQTLQWHGCFDFILNVYLEEPTFSNKLINLYVLYETFVQQKILNYFLKEKNIMDMSKPFNTKPKHAIYNYEQRMLQILGLMALTDNKTFFGLPTKTEEEEVKLWITDFNNGTENIGLVDLISREGIPLFNHLSFAEYFAACYFKEKLLLTPEDAFNVINIILKKDVTIFLYCMKQFLFPNESQKTNFDLHALHQKINETNILNYIAKNNFFHCFKHFLSFDKFKENILLEKTILHCVVESKHTDLFLCILSHIYGYFREREPTLILSLILDSLDNCKELNEKQMNSKIIQELKEFCKHGFRYDYGFSKTLKYVVLQEIPSGSHSFFLSSQKCFFSVLSFQTITEILKCKGDFMTSTTEFVSSIFVNQKLTESEKLIIFKDYWNNLAENEKRECARHVLENAMRNECTGIFIEFKKHAPTALNSKTWMKYYSLACQLNNKKIVEHLLANNFNLEKKTSSGNNVLHVAVHYHASTPILQYNVEKTGIHINSKNNYNETALLIAVKCDAMIKKIRYLLNKKSDITVLDRYGKTAFDYAIEKNNDELINVFLSIFYPNLPISQWAREIMAVYYWDDGFSSNLNDLSQWQYFNTEEDEQLSQFLIRKNIQIDLKEAFRKKQGGIVRRNSLFIKRQDYTPFKDLNLSAELTEKLTYHFNRVKNDKELDYDYGKYFATDYRDELGKTLFHYAVECGEDTSILERLNGNKEFMLSINGKDFRNKTPLDYAIKKNDYEMVKILLYKGAVFDFQNYNFQTRSDNIAKHFNKLKSIFICLYKENYCEFLEELEETGDMDFDVLFSSSDQKGKTVFDYVLKTSNYDLVKYCMIKGAVITRVISSENEKIQRLCSFVSKIFVRFPMFKYEPYSFFRYIEYRGFTEIISSVYWKERSCEIPITLIHIATRRDETIIVNWLSRKKNDAETENKKLFKYLIDMYNKEAEVGNFVSSTITNGEMTSNV